jgi:integrase
MHYFGVWSDPDAALAAYLAQKDDLHAGRTPRPDTEATTVKDLANGFLNAKQDALNAGELRSRSFADYKAVCDLIVSRFGKSRLAADLRQEDFAALRNHLAKSVGPVRLSRLIQSVRSICKYAFDAELIDRPIRFGPGFKRPSKKVLRVHRAQQGPKLFAADEVRRMIDAAGLPLKAMLLLGINCGFGNADCGTLPLSAVDLDAAMIDYPRPKTGIPRRCALWPETVAAIREALARRPTPKNDQDAGLAFITKFGLPWAKDRPGGPLCNAMSLLLKSLGINGRKGLGFYTLRHTFRTVADESKDQPAVDFIMGHEVPHMSSLYCETISDARLRAVVDHVRAWLLPTAGQ